MTNPVLAALAQARLRAAPLFARWCELNGETFCPARPATVVQFVRGSAGLGIQQLWAALEDISKQHVSMGLADPTLSAPVARAVSEIAEIVPPRSWPADWKARFDALPHDLQSFIVRHESHREKALRRAQNEAAAARQRLTALQQTNNKDESSPSHESSSQHADT